MNDKFELILPLVTVDRLKARAAALSVAPGELIKHALERAHKKGPRYLRALAEKVNAIDAAMASRTAVPWPSNFDERLVVGRDPGSEKLDLVEDVRGGHPVLDVIAAHRHRSTAVNGEHLQRQVAGLRLVGFRHRLGEAFPQKIARAGRVCRANRVNRVKRDSQLSHHA